MAVKPTLAANQQYLILDNGETFDHVILNATWFQGQGYTSSMINLFKNTSRGGTLDIITTSGNGFYPIGVQSGDTGTFNFAVMEYDQQATIGHPADYFYVNAKLHQYGSLNRWNPTGVSEGGLAIAGVSGLRFPDNYQKPDFKLNFVSQITEQDHYYQIDRVTGDSFIITLDLILFDVNMANLINALTHGTYRNAIIPISSPANSYLFGYENGSSGTYNCKLIQDVIVLKHELYNRWSVSLKFSLVQ